MALSSRVGLIGLSVTAIAIGFAFATLSNNNNFGLISKADASYTKNVTTSMLLATNLSNYRHPKKTYEADEYDKRFSIALDGGKYIDGVLLFRDCGYQYTGNSLGEYFGMNSGGESANSYNFNIQLF